MTEHIRKRAVELAREWFFAKLRARDPGLDERTAEYIIQMESDELEAVTDAMLKCLPIIDRINKGEHDEYCQSLTERIFPRMPCNCTLGQARAEADKLVGP